MPIEIKNVAKERLDAGGLSLGVGIRQARTVDIGKASGPNAVDAKVLELIYLGDHIRVRMKVAGNDEFIVKVRNRGERWDLEQGQTRTIGWSARDCKALDAVA